MIDWLGAHLWFFFLVWLPAVCAVSFLMPFAALWLAERLLDLYDDLWDLRYMRWLRKTGDTDQLEYMKRCRR